ncbi:MAG: TM1812 family CRISPR-associated protein [Planctomycetota bacterium]
MQSQHILFTALGNRAMETVYQLAHTEGTAREPLTPLALLQLLPEKARPGRVVAVCTQGARQATWGVFAEGVRRILGVEAEPIDVPDGRTGDEIREIIEKSAAVFPDGGQLTLDVTQGLRHFPFVAYALALYLTSLKGIQLRGAYYGMLEGVPRESSEPRPIVDLQPLLELPEWFHAVRVFHRTGSTEPLAGIIDRLVDTLRSEARDAGNTPELHQRATEAGKMRDRLTQLSFAYESGVPLELGRAATMLDDSIQDLSAAITERLSLAPDLIEFVRFALRPFVFSEMPGRKGLWKTRVPADEAELSRQAMLIEKYLERHQLPLAMGLLREWVVTWLMSRSGQQREWWDRSHRIQAERQLGAVAAATESELGTTLSEDQKQWGRFWKELSELRNTLHHHGMRQDSLEKEPAHVDRITAFWRRIRHGELTRPTLGGGTGTLLISPVGTRPGVLYSALKIAQPARLLVLCSRESEPSARDAVQHASFRGPVAQLIVKDPHGGFDEISGVCEEAEKSLLRADGIVANLTGGTTLMGLLIQQLVERGSRLSRPTRRVALIDRRSPQDQDAHPWVESEAYWLDEVDEL